MKIEAKKIKCQQLEAYKKSRRHQPFWIVIYEFGYESSLFDKALLSKIILKGECLSQKVNPAAANNSTTNRKQERLLNNAVAGVLAEYCWMNFINMIAMGNVVQPVQLKNTATQIDLEVVANQKTIEVRSSFPRNGLEFAICHPKYQFDILGPYSNFIKPGEIEKDFYVRTLYHISKEQHFLSLLKKESFRVYLTGGATWQMMASDTYATNKDLVPEDGLDTVEIASTYRVIPFEKALDTFEICKRIIDWK